MPRPQRSTANTPLYNNHSQLCTTWTRARAHRQRPPAPVLLPLVPPALWLIFCIYECPNRASPALALKHACGTREPGKAGLAMCTGPSPVRPAMYVGLEMVPWEDPHWTSLKVSPIFKTPLGSLQNHPFQPADRDACGCALGSPSLLMHAATWSPGPGVWLGRMPGWLKQKHSTHWSPKHKATLRTNTPLFF